MSNYNRKLEDIKAETRQKLAALKTERLYTHEEIKPKWIWILLGLSLGALITIAVIHFM